MGLKERRAAEREKYEHVYRALPTYAMGGERMLDAVDDLKWAHQNHNCSSYLDIGCGRGEMLRHAEGIGFHNVMGAEIVADLCDGLRVQQLGVHDLGVLSDASADLVTSFDVIEHLLPGDDELLVLEMGRVAQHCLALTANNKPSVDPTTGNDLHINKRPYDEWDSIIRDLLEPDWVVERLARPAKRYVSETWRAWR